MRQEVEAEAGAEGVAVVEAHLRSLLRHEQRGEAEVAVAGEAEAVAVVGAAENNSSVWIRNLTERIFSNSPLRTVVQTQARARAQLHIQQHFLQYPMQHPVQLLLLRCSWRGRQAQEAVEGEGELKWQKMRLQ